MFNQILTHFIDLSMFELKHDANLLIIKMCIHFRCGPFNIIEDVTNSLCIRFCSA